jgi:hypothetical protein
MKKLLLSFAMLGMVGCQSREQVPPAPTQAAYEPAFQPGAAALVYTPPAAVDERELGLSREGRGLYALGGVEQTIIDTTYIYQDDRQRFDRFGDWSRFERRAVSTSVTVRRR